ncbi:hypothetical protein JYT17_00540, partial [Nitrospira defluvii]|nr:hypothetical protein [Nitrospira defluvii]
CGGGGEGGPFRGSGSSFTGNLNPATASPENVTELVIAAGEATKRAAKQSVAPRDLLSSSGSISSTCGGSLNAIVLDGQSEGSFTYNNFCLGADETRVIVNGTVLFASAGNADIFGDAGNRMTFTYGDLKMDFATTNFVLNMFARCNGSLGSLVDCEYNEDFRGENNIVYKSIDTTVSGNNTAGRRIEGTVADSVQGAVLFVASDIIICDNFNIGAGNIAINDSTGTTVIDVVFSDDCATMDITYAGLTETVSQI